MRFLDHVCNRCLLSFPFEIEIAEEQEYLWNNIFKCLGLPMVLYDNSQKIQSFANTFMKTLRPFERNVKFYQPPIRRPCSKIFFLWSEIPVMISDNVIKSFSSFRLA